MKLTLGQVLKKGVEAHKAGRVTEAERCYTAILKSQPKHPDANHNMGVLAVGLGKVQEALPYFRIALEANSNIAQFWLSYIDTLIKLNKVVDAKTLLNEAKNKFRKGAEFEYIEKRLIELEKGTNINAASDKLKEPPENQLQNLINLYTGGQFQKALVQGSQLLKDFPNSFNIYNIIGAANKSLGNLYEAVKAYNKALSFKPNIAEVHNNLGNILKVQGKVEKAIEAYCKALSIKPDYAEAFINKGLALKEQGKLEEAIDNYNKALSIKPNFAEAYIKLGLALKEQGKLEKAINTYNKTLLIKPDSVEAFLNMGIELKEQGNSEEAIKAYNKALSIKPNYAIAYFNKGLAFREQGKLEEAIENNSKALTIEPDLAEAAINYFSLRNQLRGTMLIVEDKKVQSKSLNFSSAFRPKYIIHKSIFAFLNAEKSLVNKYLKEFTKCDPKLIEKLPKEDQTFCIAYSLFLKNLVKNLSVSKPTLVDKKTVFHLGDSHCLSYAHKKIKIQGIDFTVKPKITFGAKVYHISRKQKNSFKAITKANFDSIPKASKVFISFGEIDCRPNEGFINATSKLKKTTENLIAENVRGYINWFAELNQNKNHSLFFFNVPAPTYNKKFTAKVNEKVKRIIKLFNSSLHKNLINYEFNIIDVYKFTASHDGFSNGSYHLDNYHLSSDSIFEIEKQIGI